MSSADVCEGNSYTFDWIIENFSYFWTKKGSYFHSPKFVLEALGKTKWDLCLYPRGVQNQTFIGLSLFRLTDCNSSDDIEIRYELAFLGIDGFPLKSQTGKAVTTRGGNYGFCEFEKREIVFQSVKHKFLHHNTLKVRCRIWWSGGNSSNPGSSVARTVINVQRRYFIWTIEKFHSYEPDRKESLAIKTVCEESLLSFKLYLKGGQCMEDTMHIRITSHDKNIKFLTLKSYLTDKRGNRVNTGQEEFFVDDVGKVGTIQLLLTKQQLIEQESVYLSNGNLTLNFECAFSIGMASYIIETINPSCAAGIADSFIKNDSILHEEKAEADTSICLKDALKSLYNDGILSDIKLRTKTETFPTHKNILCARSPVFRAMFTINMKEKAKKSVVIPDMDDETMRQMLFYMYTDTVGDVQWENACLLYTAADKYQIISLRNKCSSILKASFSPINSCQILVLSDMHQDKDLKQAAQDYILRKSRVVLHSDEWKQLMNTNPVLAAETMYQNWNKGWVL